jgi:hypothetical protein
VRELVEHLHGGHVDERHVRRIEHDRMSPVGHAVGASRRV